MNVTALPRPIKPAPQPLGLYFRAGQNDHMVLSQILAQGQRAFYGIVFEAKRIPRHLDLVKEAERCRLECVLDPCTQASGTPGGYSDKHANLPWGTKVQARPDDYRGAAGGTRIAKLAEFAVKHGFSQIFAPTHYFADTEDPWFGVDADNIRRLRDALDRSGGKNIEILYSLCTPYACFRDENERDVIVDRLQGLPIKSLWPRIDGCGADSTPTALRNYAAACEDLARLQLPIIGDQIGGLPGLSLLALSSVGGLSTGVAVGERFDAAHWHRSQTGTPYMAHPGVYFPSIDLSLRAIEARSLFEHNLKLKGLFGCHNAECCARGITDMLENPSRHFLLQRMQQIAELSQHPESLRAALFLERHVRPMTDLVLQLSKASGIDEVLRQRFVKHRKRMDAMRITLGKFVSSRESSAHAQIPQTRAMREQIRPTNLSLR